MTAVTLLWAAALAACWLARLLLGAGEAALLVHGASLVLLPLAYLIHQPRLGGARTNALGLLAAAGVALVFGLRALVLAFQPEMVWLPGRIGAPALVAAAGHALLGWGAFTLGYHAFRDSRPLAAAGVWLFDRRFAFPAVLLMCLAGLAGRAVQAVYYFSPAGWVGSLGGLPGYAIALGYLGAGILLVERRRYVRAGPLAALVTLAGYLLGSLIMGERIFLLRMIAYVLVYLLLAGSLGILVRRPRRLLALAGAAAVFLVLFGAVSAYKSHSGRVGELSGLERGLAALELYRGLVTGSVTDASGDAGTLAKLSRRTGSGLDLFALLIEGTPDIWDWQRGRTLALVGTTFVPRALWPEKPEVTMAGRFYEDYLDLRRVRGHGAAGYSTVGDLWLNFQAAGVLLGMLLLGLLCRGWQILCLGGAAASPVAGILFLATTAPDLLQPSGTVSDTLGVLLVRSAVLLPILVLLGRRRLDRAAVLPCT